MALFGNVEAYGGSFYTQATRAPQIHHFYNLLTSQNYLSDFWELLKTTTCKSNTQYHMKTDKVTYERLLVFDQPNDFHRILIGVNVFRQRR